MRERESVQLEFVKIKTIGQSVWGKITRYDENDNGPFITLEPVFVQADRGANTPWKKYGGAAVGLSTDLRRKIKKEDVGKLFLLQFTDTKDTGKGAPQKLYKVFELDKDEAKGLASKAKEGREGELNPGGNPAQDDDDDDLPF